MPSITNGQRINQLVAPTIFWMDISSRRANMASLTVLAMMKIEITPSHDHGQRNDIEYALHLDQLGDDLLIRTDTVGAIDLLISSIVCSASVGSFRVKMKPLRSGLLLELKFSRISRPRQAAGGISSAYVAVLKIDGCDIVDPFEFEASALASRVVRPRR